MDDAAPSTQAPDSPVTAATASVNGSATASHVDDDAAIAQAELVAFLALAGELAAGLKVLAVGIDAARLAGIAEQIDAFAFDQLSTVEPGGYRLVVADFGAEATDPAAVAAELIRVAGTQDGLVLARIPNSGEFTAAEKALVAASQNHLIYRQHNWVASAVFDDALFSTAEPNHAAAAVVRKTAGLPAGDELYTVVLVGNGELPAARTQLAVTRSPRLRELTEELHALRAAAAAAAAKAQAEHDVQTERIRELSEQIAWFDEYELNLRKKIEQHAWAMTLLTLWRGAIVNLRRVKRALNR